MNEEKEDEENQIMPYFFFGSREIFCQNPYKPQSRNHHVSRVYFKGKKRGEDKEGMSPDKNQNHDEGDDELFSPFIFPEEKEEEENEEDSQEDIGPCGDVFKGEKHIVIQGENQASEVIT